MNAPAVPDALTPFVVEGAAVRGALVTLDAASREILAQHDYPPALARVLGELLAAATLLASTLKLDGSLLVQLAGTGPVRLLVVECTDGQALRATAQWDAAAVAALGPVATLGALAGDAHRARLTITVDPRAAGTLYQGIVAFESDSVAGLIEHYLATSEQLASRLVLAQDDGRAAGLLLQRLPGSRAADDATWDRVGGALMPATVAALLEPRPALAALAALLPTEDLRVFGSRAIVARCSCTRERVEKALRVAGRDEIEAALSERGLVEVTCEFCGKRYTFTPLEARAVFGAPGAPPTRH